MYAVYNFVNWSIINDENNLFQQFYFNWLVRDSEAGEFRKITHFPFGDIALFYDRF